MTLLDKVEVDIAAIVGERRLRLGDILRLRRGGLIELNRPAADHLTLAVEGCEVGAGQLVRAADGALQAVVTTPWRRSQT